MEGAGSVAVCLGPPPPGDAAPLTYHALERSTETLLGNEAREKLEPTPESMAMDGLAVGVLATVNVI